MILLRSTLFLAIVTCVSSCGRQVVEFKLGGDAGLDARTDSRLDALTDALIDGTPDALADAGTDSTPIDALADASSDAPSDASTDAPTDASTDASTDAPTDAPTDASSDAPIDSGMCVQAPVVLGVAGDFAVLAGSTVTNTGLSTVTGDLGVSPGTAVTGFPPGILVGMQHTDTTSQTAEANLTTAYNDAAGRTLCAVSVAGNLGGMTLPPGLYKSTSFLEISSGDLTLDAGGNSSAVWVFQMSTTMTTTIGRQVILTGGALPSNIYWQVGTSATIGTASMFSGTIMADQAITLETGAVLNGRALARIAAVTLDTNTVVKQ